MTAIEFNNAVSASGFFLNENGVITSSKSPMLDFANGLSRAKSVQSWMRVCMEGNFPGDMVSCGFVNARMFMVRDGRDAFEASLHKFLPQSDIKELCDAIVACRRPEFLTSGKNFTNPRHTNFSFEQSRGAFRATMVEQINERVWVGMFVGAV